MVLFNIEDVNFKDIIKYPNIKIESGKVTFIKGESGSGKSTLLKLLNKSQSPLEGNIYFKDEDIENIDGTFLRKNVALVSQEVFLFEGSVIENFKRFYDLRGLNEPNEKYISEICQLCGVDFSLSNNCISLSGGERQRVYLAIFLSLKPKIILLDEPTSALDNKTSFKVMENIISFAKKNSIEVIAISHNDELINKFAENIIVIRKDRI